ncbi:MAG TPA: hypothetical protein VHO84_09335 [Syntrophorhabdaceae bacterium]|nr:hypothetical protein [Syntrophorhabdaceae bacterium]
MKRIVICITCMIVLAVSVCCFAAVQNTTRSPEKLYAVYDGNWGLAYYIKGNSMFDTNWELEYYIKGNTLFDKNWKRYGVIKGNDIYDDHNYLRYRIKEYNPPPPK